MSRWKEMWDKIKEGNRYLILLGILGFIGVVLMLSDPTPAPRDENQQQAPPVKDEVTTVNENMAGMDGEERQLAEELAGMLSRINGVGKVKVSVRLASSVHAHYAYNTESGNKITREQDQSGGTRTTTENTESEQLVLVQAAPNNEKPVVEKEVASDIAGVMVVATGANKPEVKARLFQAVQVALGVDPHKVIVLPMEGGGGE